MKLDSLGLPIVLLGALWGAVNTTLRFYELINARRDEIFAMIDECSTCADHTLGPWHIYFSNVVPLTVGLCLFLAVISFVVLSIPRYMHIEDGVYRRRMVFACKLIAVLPVYGLLAFIAGGVFDAVMIVRSF